MLSQPTRRLSFIFLAVALQCLTAPAYAQSPSEDTDALVLLMNPFDPAKRAEGATRLGKTGNPRYAEPLSFALRDRNRDVRVSAASALGRLPESNAMPVLESALQSEESGKVQRALLTSVSSFTSPKVEGLLRNALLDPLSTEPTQKHVLSLLAGRKSPGLERFLIGAMDDAEEPLRAEIASTLRLVFGVEVQDVMAAPPKVEVKRETKRPPAEPTPEIMVPPSGGEAGSGEAPPEVKITPAMRSRWLIIGTSAFYSASFLELLRRGAESEVSPAWTYPIGLTVGGGTAYLMTHFSQEISLGKSLWWGSAGAWGIAASHFTANAVKEETLSHRRLFNLGGEMIGLGAGALSARRLDWSVGDTMYVNTTGFAGTLFGWGLEVWTGPNYRVARPQGLSLLGAAGGLAAGAFTTERVSFSRSHGPLILASTAYGTWAGTWAPYMLNADSSDPHVDGGSLVGLSGGYAVGLLLSQRISPRPGSILKSITGATLGNQFGASLGFLVFDEFQEPAVVSMELFGAAGLLTGAYYESIFPATREQPRFKALLFGTQAYYGIFLPRALGRHPSLSQKFAGANMGFPLALAGTLALGNGVEIPPRATAGLFLGEVLGGMSGAGIGLLSLTGYQGDAILLLSGSTLGLSAGYQMSQRLSWSFDLRERIFITLSGVSGLWYGAWAPRIAPDRYQTGKRSAGGAMTLMPPSLGAAFLIADRNEIPPRVVPGVFMGQALGNLFGYGLGGLTLVDNPTRTALMLSGGVLGGAGGYLFARRMAEPSPVRTHSQAILVALGTGSGAWYGGWLSRYFRSSSGEISEDRVKGGISVGSVTAFSGVTWISNHYDVQPRVLPGLFFGQVFGSSIGAGAGLLATAPDSYDSNPNRIRRQLDRASLLMVAGGLAGGTGGYYFSTRMAEPGASRGTKEAKYVLLNGVSGAWYGAWLPTLREPRLDLTEGRHVWGGMMIGVPVSLASSIWVTNHVELRPRTVRGLLFGELLGTSFGTGVGMMTLWSSRAVRSLMISGTAAGEIGGYFFSKHMGGDVVDLDRRDRMLVTLGTLSGMWYGAWLPMLTDARPSDVPSRRIFGGIFTGAPLALSSSLWIASKTDIPPRVIPGVFLGELAGISMGAGAGLVSLANPRATNSIMLSGGLLGAVGGYTFASSMAELSPLKGPREKSALLLSGFSGAWNGAWAGSLLSNENESGDSREQRAMGGALLGAPMGFLSATWLLNRHEMPEGLLGGVFGGEIFGWSIGTGIGLVSLSSRRMTTSLMLGGGTAGAIGGYYLSGSLPPRSTTPYRSLLAATTATGLWYGGWMPTFTARARGSVESRRVLGGLMIGGPAGLGTGLILQHREVSPKLYTGVFLGEVLGSSAGAGTGLVLETSHRKMTGLMLGGGVLSAWATGQTLDRVEFSQTQRRALGVGAFFGTAYGAVLPYVVEGRRRDVSSSQVVGGVMTGLPAGLAATTLSFTTWDPPPGTLGLTFLSGIIGSVAGLGLGLAIEDWNSRLVVTSMYSTGLSGLALGARSSTGLQFTRGAMLFAGFGTLYGFSQGLALSYFSESSPRQTAGALMLGSAMGLGTSLIVTHDVEVGTGRAAVAYTGGLWGAAVGSMFAQAAAGSPQTTTTAAVIASNVGQIGTSYTLLFLRVPPRRMGWINLFGLTGLGIGSAIGLPLSEGGDIFFLTAPTGSLLGLGIGALVTSRWDWSEKEPEKPAETSAPMPQPLDGGSPGRRRPSWMPVVDAWAPQFGVVPEQGGEERDPRYTLGVIILYH